jgi:hypothetical protein
VCVCVLLLLGLGLCDPKSQDDALAFHDFPRWGTVDKAARAVYVPTVTLKTCLPCGRGLRPYGRALACSPTKE